MRITPQILITLSIVFICWLFTEAGLLISHKRGLPIQTKGRYSFELSQRGVPLSTCPDCYTVKDRARIHVRYRPNPHNYDVLTIESLHEAIVVIASIVIATSWITIFSLFLHGRIQRNMDQRFRAIVMGQLDPHQSFIFARRQG